jgi:nucleotide-binding universal stress UspA family protein
MLTLKKILFPVDFSEPCIGAARYVAAFAGRFDAEITMIHVVPLAHYNDLIPENLEQRQQRLDSFLAKEFEYFRVQRVLTDGDPATAIVNYAAHEKFDLIMLPTLGLGDFRRFLLGSVTAKVLHDAECPVWTGVHLAQRRRSKRSLLEISSAPSISDPSFSKLWRPQRSSPNSIGQSSRFSRGAYKGQRGKP